MIHDSHLANCCGRFEESRQRFERLTGSISAKQALWQPAPDRWSVAQCLEHLRVTLSLYEDPLASVIQRAREQSSTGSGPWRRRTIAGTILLWALDPEARRQVPAPSLFRPASSGDLDFPRVCNGFRSRLQHFTDLSRAADGLDLDRLRVPTPISPLFRITAAEAFEVHARHLPRHLAQAEALTRMADYPS